jgi:hypothetical protein
MRDEYDARFWNDHHRAFVATVSGWAQRHEDRQAFRRKTMTHIHDFRLHLLAALAAISVSSLTILGTIGPIDTAAPAVGQTAEAGATVQQAA